jgi:acetyl esterase/lipase
MRPMIAALAVLMLAAAPAAAGPLMDWPDLTSRTLPQPGEKIAYGPGAAQFGELWLPAGAGPHPLVILIHGGCWVSRIAGLSIMDYAAEDLRRRGLAVWNIEYRGVDQPGGGYPGTYQDAAAAADALEAIARSRGLDLGRVVAVGHSAGAHLAAWLAARPRLPAGSPLAAGRPLPIAAVVSLGGLADLKADRAARDAGCGPRVVDAMTGAPGPGRGDVFADTSPPELAPLGAPQAVINAEQDSVAPPWLGEAYAGRLRAAGDPVERLVIPDAGHVELIAPGTTAWEASAAVIERLARGAGR